jgi:DNA-binding response OmpR family regulator
MTARVIVIEDDFALGISMQAYLHSEGYTVDLYRDGREGLQAILSDPPDVIFLDLMMPHDGYQTLQTLSEHGLSGRTWVVTALTDAQTREFIERHGAAGLMKKPFDNQQLAWAVQQTLQEGLP